jgi:YHS domain-containing protein
MKKLSVIGILCLILTQSCSHKLKEGETILCSDVKNKATCVSFTSDQTGNPVINWCEVDATQKKFFFFSFFDAGTNSFPDKVAVPIEQSTSLHEEGMPKIAIKGNGTIVAVYETAAPTAENRFAGFVKYIQSFDKGKTWTVPHFLHADTTAGKGHSFASVTRLSNGEVGASWLDVSFGDNKTGRSVKFAVTNGQSGFNGEKVIDSFACQCCRTAISCDAKGDISIMFRDILSDSIRDMSVATSADNGQTFTKPVSFTNDDWVINGCPHNGPSVANTGGNTYAAWFTGGSHSGLYYAALNTDKKMTDRKKISGKGRNIQLCVLPGDKSIVAYNETVKQMDSFYSKISVNKIVAGKMFTTDITSGKSHAGYPVLHSLGNKVVVAWEDNDKIYYRIVNENEIAIPVTNAEVNFSPAARLSVFKLAINKDLVCGMPVSASVTDTVHRKENIYGFCSPQCKEEFLKNPESFLAAKEPAKK